MHKCPDCGCQCDCDGEDHENAAASRDCIGCGYCDDDDDADSEESRDCTWCGGDGWQECDDPIQCTYPHNRLGECPCLACGGSGLAKDQRIW